MADSEEADGSHIKLHQINTFSQGSLVKTSYQPKGGTAAVIVSSATTHLQTTSTQVSRISTVPIQAGPAAAAAAAASYHVPRGAAAVANMSAPRSSVATPVLRGAPLPLPIGARAVLPAGVQPPRQSAKIPAHHVGAMRSRGVTVASKQQQVVSGRLLGPTLVAAAARPPHSTIITSTVLTKPVVMLSSPSMVRGGVPSQQTATAKHYHQTDQSTSTTKLYQTDQSTSTTTKLYQQTEGTTVKVYQTADQSGAVTAKLYHHGDQSTPTSTKIFSPTEQVAGQQPQSHQPIYLHHKPHIVGGGMYVSQTGASGGSAGVVVASGMAQAHSAVVVPHSTVTGQHGTVVQQHGALVQTHGSVGQSHGTVMAQHVTVAQQHCGAAVLQAHSMAQQHGTVLQSQTHPQQHSSTVQSHASIVQQHGSTVQTHASLVQQHGAVVHQATHTGVGVPHGGIHQSTHASVQSAHTSVPQGHSIVSAQPHTGSMQPNSQAPYIEISRQMVRPTIPQSQATAATAIHQQSTVSQVMRFNPVVVVEAGRPQSFQGLLSAATGGNGGGGGGSSDTTQHTLTALPPGVAHSMTMTPVSSPHHPIVSVAQQVSVSTSLGQITAHSASQVPHAAPPQSLAVGSLPVSSIPQSLSTAVAQSLTPKQNTSPRPSILRKRDPDSWSNSMKAQRNLVPVLSGLNVVTPSSVSSVTSSPLTTNNLVQTPVTPQTQTLSLAEDDVPPGSAGSSTLSAASSPDATTIEHPSPVPSVSAAACVPAASSPRKKPRKQQLPHNPPPSRPSPFSDEDMQFLSDKPHSNSKPDFCVEEEKRKRMSLLKTYRQGWKPTQNHFMRYCDVRCKEDKKPTLTELANQKNALHIINGWKIYHLLAQIEDMVNTETEYCGLFTSLLATMEEKQQKIRNRNPDKKTDELLSRLNERIKANAQRCKVVNDHMNESKGQFMKLFEHKAYVADLINRFANKRSVKKRERV